MAPKQRSSADTNDQIRERRKHLRTILNRLRKHYPGKGNYERKVSFVDSLIAIVLSQNTSDVNSHRAYVALRNAYPHWEDVAAADQKELAETIRAGGLADQKSRSIINTLQAFQERWDDFNLDGIENVPDDDLLKYLTSIKGVGLKSASCAMMFALDRDLCAVDTHLHRVLNRLGVVETSTADKTFHELRPLIPKGKARELHVSLIRFGRDVCKSRLPHCFECPLYSLCSWDEKEAHAKAGKRGAKPVSGDFLITDGI